MNIKPAGCYILLLFSLCLVTPASSSSGQPSDVFQRADHNGDGLIDPAEFPGDRAWFDALDSNKDGFLTREELRSTIEQASRRTDKISVSEQREQGGPAGRTGFGGSGGPGGPDARNNKDAHGFKQDDANHDGRVSRSEFGGPADLFDKLDANDDGYITEEEASSPGQGPSGPPRQ